MVSKTFTAFPKLEEQLKELVRTVDLDQLKTERVPVCTFFPGYCHGMCCSIPVAVTVEEEEVLARLVKEKAKAFKKIGCRVFKNIVRVDLRTNRRRLSKKWRGIASLNRIVRDVMERRGKLSLSLILGLKDYTRICIFAIQGGGCALQILAEQEGRHKWFYKPVNCWKYPLTIRDGTLTLPTPFENAYFPCHAGGTSSVAEGLTEELELMGRILGRDLLNEISDIR